MRMKLACLNNQIVELNVTVGIRSFSVPYGTSFKKKFICLENIKTKNNKTLTDHIWIKQTKSFKGIPKGTKLKISCKVIEYYKKVDGILVKDYCVNSIHIIK